MMRRAAAHLVPMLVLLMALAPTSDATARHKAATRCPPRHSYLITADAQAAVYEPIELYGRGDIYGCSYGRRSYDLGYFPSGAETGGAGIEHETLSGTVVAYEQWSYDEFPPFPDPSSEELVVVRDMRTGRVLHKLPTGTRAPEKLPHIGPIVIRVGIGPVVTLVVKSDGAVAWIAENREGSPEGAPHYYEVHAVDQLGNRLVASGTSIDPHSLALAGSNLYWTQSGDPFSVTLH